MSLSFNASSGGTSVRRPRLPPILWDVVEEHLQEASFFWRQWERALFSSEESLDDVAGGDEHRLKMHLDALLVAGGAISQRVLRPALEATDDFIAGPAAYALLESMGQQALPPVLDALVNAEDEKRRELCRAVALSSRPDLDAALIQALPRYEAPLQALLVKCLASRHADAGSVLESLYPNENTSLRAAVIQASRHTEHGRAHRLVQRGLEESHPQVRDAALLTGLILGSRAAWWQCRSAVRTQSPQLRGLLLALGMSGDPAEVEVLLSAMEQPSLRTSAIQALGLSGQRAAADALLGVLTTQEAVLAAESFSAITGLVMSSDLIEEATSSDDDEPAGQWESSPWGPRAPAIRGRVRADRVDAWWKNARSRFEPGRRYLQGHLWTPELLIQALEVLPTRRRPPLALELAIRTQGAVNVETTAWTSRQRGQLLLARQLRPGIPVGSFDSFMRL